VKFRFRYIQRGGHVHVRVFQSTSGLDGSWEKNGDLVFDEPAWRGFFGAFSADTTETFSFLPEEPT
jgi:hypothetical protein